MFCSKPSRSIVLLLSLWMVGVITTVSVDAHIAGRLGVDNYIRVIPRHDLLEVEYDVHFGELPTAGIAARPDVNRDGEMDSNEMMAYAKKATVVYARRLNVVVSQGDLRKELQLSLLPNTVNSNCIAYIVNGDDGAKTFRIIWRFGVAWPDDILNAKSGPLNVTVSNPSLEKGIGLISGESRASWIFATGTPEEPFKILASDVPTDKIMPRPLDDAPVEEDVTRIPYMSGANFVCSTGSDSAEYTAPATVGLTSQAFRPSGPVLSQSSEPRYESALRVKVMSLFRNHASGVSLFVMLLLCCAWGAAHAFTPGHGKVIASTYLVSNHASYLHALLLGILVTITHTAAVVILAVAALILKDRFVYPV